MTHGLTPKQKRFADEYLIDHNAKQAAVRAGYSPKTAQVQGSRLLSYAKVGAYLSKKAEKLVEKSDLSAQMVIDELRKIGFSNIGDYFSVKDGTPKIDFSAMTPEQAAVISEISTDTLMGGDNALAVQRVKFKLHDKIQALSLLGKYFKLFSDRVEHTGKDGGPIEVTDPTDIAKRIAFALAQGLAAADSKEKA